MEHITHTQQQHHEQITENELNNMNNNGKLTKTKQALQACHTLTPNRQLTTKA